MTGRKAKALAVLGLVAIAALGLWNAPIVYARLAITAANLRIPLPRPPAPDDPQAFAARPGQPLGQLIDDYWLVQKIADDTYAIGEPASDPDNYEYLLIGEKRALLIDSGMSGRDIHAALHGLTDLPITVIPTHLHYDHSNGLANFSDIALIDLPETRSRADGDVVVLSRTQYMAAPPPGKPRPTFTVAHWLAPGEEIDLGGRKVRILSTPGHTATSVSIYDPAAKLLFSGDLIYTTTLYAQMADSSLSAYQTTLDGLIAMLPPDSRIYGAHCCRNDVVAQAPYLAVEDLRDARTAITAVVTGTLQGKGLILRRFPVNSRMTLLTFYPFGDR